jgi:ATP-dependent Clp protease ATP-binding subunit ClpB
VAQGNNQQVIEPGHLLKGILHSAENVVSFLLKKLGVNISHFQQALDKMVESYPRVTGGEPFLSSAADRVLQKSLAFALEMGDQFVSVEHILLALLESNDMVLVL